MKTILGWIDDAGQYQTFRWDCTLSRRLRVSGQATTSPVEDGSVVGDHVTFLPDAITLAGLVTNTPIVKSPQDYPTVPGEGLTRASGAWDVLEAIFRARRRVSVLMPQRVFEGMVITALEPNDEPKKGPGLWVTIELKEMPLVYPDSVALPPPVTSKSALVDSTVQNNKEWAKQKLAHLEDLAQERERWKTLNECGTSECVHEAAEKFEAEDILADKASVWSGDFGFPTPP